MWDVGTGELKGTLTGHPYGASSVVFSPDSKALASGSGDDTVPLWDTETGELKKTLRAEERKATPIVYSNKVHRAAFSPDGTTLASGGWDGTVLVWKVD